MPDTTSTDDTGSSQSLLKGTQKNFLDGRQLSQSHAFNTPSTSPDLYIDRFDMGCEINHDSYLQYSDDHNRRITKLGLELAGKGLSHKNGLTQFHKGGAPIPENKSIHIDPSADYTAQRVHRNLSSSSTDSKHLDLKSSPTFFTERLKAHKMTMKDFRDLAKLIDSSNSTQNNDWCHEFLRLDGVDLLRKELKRVNKISIKSNEQLKKWQLTV
ncbi:hypothetical protein PMKS-000210 [Pichia membranifaciens]|uniref:Uncharacterized protein n=1 Tax=Pichia membranifaciens TaxID=4926 RepID=A0A1Q2YB43_9ASCO|nr:hypothetical protein PMKS-000210 [Pichia membranifaciens]